MKRAGFLPGPALLVLLVAAPQLATAGPAADRRPNILFCMADDWAWPHAGVYGDKVVRTPTFDRLAKEGVLFSHAFCVAPSCTASRAAVLTGQFSHRLGESGNLHSILRKQFDCYPDLLEDTGYFVGFTRKGWGPGILPGSGRTRNPAGPLFKDFVPADRPFCFWFGSHDPHRPYARGSGVQAGLKPADVFVPPYLPDTADVRSDICDYYYAVQRFDREVGEVLMLLEKAGRLENTLVIVTGDNGWPFPRAKANLYDAGTRQPLAVVWPARIPGGRTSDAYISFQDFAPTILEAAGLKPTAAMTGRSFLDLLTTGKSAVARDRVFVERERHANVRQGDLGYPARAVRTREFLYIRNFHPERWPAGDPEMWQAVGPFGDIDGGPTKDVLLQRRQEAQIAPFFALACGKRPAEELYDLASDPYQLTNVVGRPEYAAAHKKLRADLERWMHDTGDPRATGDDDRWDRYPYHGGPPKKPGTR
jgi:arylsulfatase A-like enzyme